VQGRLESRLFVLSVFARRRMHLRRRAQVYLVAFCVEISCFRFVGCGEGKQRAVCMQGFFNQQRDRARAQVSSGIVKEGGGAHPKEPLQSLC
jgi:hypothetical protein